MALSPIPVQMLTDDVIARVCSGIDVWKNPTYNDTTINNCCVQIESKVVTSVENTTKTKPSTLFADAVLSTPFDWYDAFNVSLGNGGALKVVYKNDTFIALSVSVISDDAGNIHHYEVYLQ